MLGKSSIPLLQCFPTSMFQKQFSICWIILQKGWKLLASKDRAQEEDPDLMRRKPNFE